ncbi:UDP-N-acetylmuramoylalanyl-D-glutamate--2,6-diaminopimelate ligase [Caloranaerobacter azorensis DSM 13643]|uniref:UDP-N-acetylmuramoyl-L-alanyl-D-glutamate--2,6-diaminopimelate ligase n=1 Tax=Caloranaerobacter azorensis DSM 13643 TaxID=1121264 RepID=A0A1M5U2U9_9FIRM|nr:UDP-N-acetylmuramoyl-L-alanyl-D-glutamate--2,6-diaminopimelate ligase [Caloranaerobacter azorensis]SHH57190.1 UDP-N-acetylmuramoylalanyl-D-glutamate--2,6-diaminopimelate ligase [Caloranaerobacter azorensis DSM 13643]
MKLIDLINGLEIEKYSGDLDIEISKIVYDSRKAENGCIFVAIKGYKTDGHNYINQAISNGAKAVILQRDINIPENIVKILVKDTRCALARISSNYYKNPSEKLELIGITGTNGKTTTTYLIKSILEASGKNVGLIGTIGNVINGEIVKSKNTTPESLDLQEFFNRMVNTNIDSCVMEVSSHSLELKRVEYCDFNVGIFTNLTPEHLDFHKDLQSYMEAKVKLFYKTRDYNIINIDDEYGRKIQSIIQELDTPILTYGIEKKADIMARNIEIYASGVKFDLITPDGSIDIRLNIPGKFSVYNALAAASCGIAFNIKLEDIKRGLETIQGVRGRFEVVPTNTDFSVIIDYAHTPDGFKKVLSTIDQFAKGRKMIVFGCGGDRDKTKRPKMGEIASHYCDICIITTDNPRTENPKEIVKDILRGIDDENCECVIIEDRKEAIRYALEIAKKDDVILLAGKGHETYQIIGKEVLPFDEREIVLGILNEGK